MPIPQQTKQQVKTKLGHDQKKSSSSGEFIKSAIYGGLDGLVTALIIAVSAVGSNSTPDTVIALGIASLVGDGLGMAVADYLSTKSDDQYMLEEQRREQKEFQNDPQAQKQQMIELYVQKGIERKDAVEIVSILVTNVKGFIRVMMIQQLQLIAGEQNPFRNGIVTFFSFALFGFTPLIPTLIALILGRQTIEQGILYATIAISVFFLGVLGLGKSCVGGPKWYFSIMETVVIGAIAASLAFVIGKGMGQ